MLKLKSQKTSRFDWTAIAEFSMFNVRTLVTNSTFVCCVCGWYLLLTQKAQPTYPNGDRFVKCFNV